MYEELVKKYLKLKVNEADAKIHPGITLTKSIQTQDKKINNDATKEIEKKMKEYDTASAKEGKDSIVPPKTNIEKADGTEKYHEEIEMAEDNLDLTYDMLEVPEKFTDRVKKAVEGDSTMGNKVYTGKDNGNTESVWGASTDDYGKKLVKTKIARAKDTSQSPPQGGGTNGKAAGITRNATALTKKGNEKTVTTPFSTKKKDATTESVEKQPSQMTSDELTAKGREAAAALNHAAADFYAEEAEKRRKEENNNKKISEVKMKRLRFKKPFNGMKNAINIIPESYKVDNKTFEMTDGNETYKVRWEGTLTEGKAIVLQESNQTFVNEDMAKIKHLMGYKSEDTLGTVKGRARISEDEAFVALNAKMRVLTEEKAAKAEAEAEKKNL
jgi:hypothetical protein